MSVCIRCPGDDKGVVPCPGAELGAGVSMFSVLHHLITQQYLPFHSTERGPGHNSSQERGYITDNHYARDHTPSPLPNPMHKNAQYLHVVWNVINKKVKSITVLSDLVIFRGVLFTPQISHQTKYKKWESASWQLHTDNQIRKCLISVSNVSYKCQNGRIMIFVLNNTVQSYSFPHNIMNLLQNPILG